MSKGLLFFCCACCVLVLTIINLSIGPVISGRISRSYGYANCPYYKDQWDIAKDDQSKTDDYVKFNEKWNYDQCQRGKGLHDMEYTSFIFDIVIGFICALIGLLHLFDLKKDFVVNTGIIGLICGIVGFVLTFVYVIFNGIYCTTYGTGVYKRDGDGVFAEKTETGKFKCLYYDKPENFHSYQATYSELNKKQYNYKKDFLKDVDPNCIYSSNSYYDYPNDYPCSQDEIITLPLKATCEKLYLPEIDEVENKDYSDRFLTALILSLFVCLANIGLALFGFLLFRTPNDF
jgi:hypothetical protein